MNPIDQAKTIMQEIKKKQIECDIVWNSHKKGIARLCGELNLIKARIDQMEKDLLNEKEFWIFPMEAESWAIGYLKGLNQEPLPMLNKNLERIMKRLKEINSALEILGGKR